MTNPETLFYAVLIVTNCIIAWQWAKQGFWEIAIQIPTNKKAFGAVFIGVVAVFIASLAEKKGYISISLAKEENMLKGALLILGSPVVLFLAARYVILPKGLPEYNRARNRTFYWTREYYKPGINNVKKGDSLAQFPMAQTALDFFKKSIALQKKGQITASITKEFTINEEQVAWDGCTQVNCPNCGFPIKTPVANKQDSGICNVCDSNVAFKVIDNMVYVTAFGNKIRRRITSSNKYNIAVIYEEMALLLRMMNKFNEASSALDKSEEIINVLLEDSRENEKYLATKSLILFRKGELAHTMGEKAKAKSFYQKSLNIDRQIGHLYCSKLIEGLIKKVS